MSSYSIPKMTLPDLKEKRASPDKIFFASIDIVILQQADMITKKEMINLYKMIRSEDQENLTVALEIIKQKIDNFKDE